MMNPVGEQLAKYDFKKARRAVGQLERKNPFGEFKMLPVAELQYERAYQRAVSLSRVREMAENFDPLLLQPLWVGLRNEKYFVVDGQHRTEMCRVLGIVTVPCIVYRSPNYKFEAQYFVALQEKRRKLLSWHKFQAKIAYGDPAAIAISHLLSKYGFRLKAPTSFGNRMEDNVLQCISTLEYAYAAHGEQMIEDLLFVLRNAWDGSGPALQRVVVHGLMRLLEGTKIGRTRLVASLKERDPYTLSERALRFAHNNGVIHTEAMRETLAAVIT